jgi:hypothetical protein
LEPLAWFFLNIIESSLADIAFYRRKYANFLKLSPSAISVLDCFNANPEKRLKTADIAKKTGFPRRTVQYALKSLATKEFIRLLGEGPASRYQLLF